MCTNIAENLLFETQSAFKSWVLGNYAGFFKVKAAQIVKIFEFDKQQIRSIKKEKILFRPKIRTIKN